MRKIVRYIALLACLACLLGSVCVPTALAASPYYIEVDQTNEIVTIFDTSDDSIACQFACSTGTENYPSPKGTFYLPQQIKKMERSEWYAFEEGWGRYATRIYSVYLFHSYLFDSKSVNSLNWDSVSQFGVRASHGCTRLYIFDAQWIAENVPAGTKVKIFFSGESKPYLRQLLSCNSFHRDDGVSYSDFTGIVEEGGDGLGYGSEGEEVKAFQQKLIDMGLYTEDADGIYDEGMVRLVRILQQTLGLKVNGICDDALLEALDSDNAPESVLGTYRKGDSGSGVSVLQSYLASLGVYTGSVTGTFDDATEQAVLTWQKIAGITEDGIASSETMASLISTLKKLNREFGEGGFALYTTTETATVCMSNSESRLNVRAKASKDSTIYAYLEPGKYGQIIEKGDTWTKVRVNGQTGYVMTQYLDFVTISNTTYDYGAPDETHPAIQSVTVDTSRLLATQNTVYATSTAKGNLIARFSASEKAVTIFKLPPGVTVRVLSTDGKYSRIRYGEKEGYVLSKYLKTTTVTELADIEEDPEPGVISYGRLKKFSDPYLYAEADLDSDYLTELLPGTQIGIMGEADENNMVRVTYRGLVGYISTARVTVEEVTKVDDPTPYSEVTASDPDGGSFAEGGSDEEDFADEDFMEGDFVEEDFVDGEDPADEGASSGEEILPDLTDTALGAVSTGDDTVLLNLRSLPSSDGEVLQQLGNGTEVVILEDLGDWLQVSIGYATGYVMAMYIEKY